MTLALIGIKDPLLLEFASFYKEKNPEYNIIIFSHEATEPSFASENTEFPLHPLSPEALLQQKVDLAIFFKDGKNKELILELEDQGLTLIDLSEHFRFDSTIPLATRTLPSAYNSLITSVPSYESQSISELLISLDRAYQLKRVSINVFKRDFEADLFMSQESTDEELVMINEITKILDNSRLRITSSVYKKCDDDMDSIVLMTEFVKPFNMNGIEEILEEQEDLAISPASDLDQSNLIMRRFRRDLSVDSGMQFHIAIPSFKRLASTNLSSLTDHLLKHKNG